MMCISVNVLLQTNMKRRYDTIVGSKYKMQISDSTVGRNYEMQITDSTGGIRNAGT